jgi:hypothetical protein
MPIGALRVERLCATPITNVERRLGLRVQWLSKEYLVAC